MNRRQVNSLMLVYILFPGEQPRCSDAQIAVPSKNNTYARAGEFDRMIFYFVLQALCNPIPHRTASVILFQDTFPLDTARAQESDVEKPTPVLVNQLWLHAFSYVNVGMISD
jgi:hypothetical protein